MPSTSKTAKLQLNVWAASDNPMRTDFNSDNERIDAAVVSLESSLASNTSDHASIRSEMSQLVGGASDELRAYARETRRLALDAYAMASVSEIASLEPNASEAWVEDFSDISDLDFSSATTARYLVSPGVDHNNITPNYIGAVCGISPSFGDVYALSVVDNIALPFTLTEASAMTGLLSRPVYTTSLTGNVDVTCVVYKATASGGTYTLGEQVFSATKPRATTIFSSSTPYNDDPINFVDTPFTLAAGTYCVVFYGQDLRYYHYNETEDDGGNPKLAPYDKLYTLPGGDPSAALTVTTNRFAGVMVHWMPNSSPLAQLHTAMLGFDRPIESAAVYLYTDTNDLQCACTVLGSSGAGSDLAVDPDMQNAPCLNGLYVTKLSGTLASALTNVKLRIGMHSPSTGLLKRILFVAMRTEA